MKRTIAICNQAGGVGKTTTTRDLGFELAERGHRVLVLDADSQGSLGEFLGLNPHRSERQSIWQFIASEADPAREEPPPDMLCEAYGLTVGISNLQLIKLERRLIEQRQPHRLYTILASLGDRFDYVLIDCPPNINEISIQALFAADELIVPVQTEEKAVAGMFLIQEELIETNKRRMPFRPTLKIAGFLPTRYNPSRNLHKHCLTEIERMTASLNCALFDPIREYIAVAEACNAGKPLKLHAPHCPAVRDIQNLADRLSA
ncbi:MAG: ParA family protein [Blastocatellia bacterium]|nr:ParA family protein [Blastocatellia bacterium]